MLNNLYSETSHLNEVADELRRRLPPGWSLDRSGEGFRAGWGGVRKQTAFALKDSRGESATIIVEAQGKPLEARTVRSLLLYLRSLLYADGEVQGPDECRILMLIAPFVGPAAKERLADAGISYADATGNMRFVTTRPAVFIENEGGCPQSLAGECAAAFTAGTA